MAAIYDETGQVRQLWDDETRTYTEWDAQGVVVDGFPRPYTVQENAAAELAAAENTAATNDTVIRDKARQALNVFGNRITQLESFAAGTSSLSNAQRDAALRDLAGNLALGFRAINGLIRLELRDLNSTDGT